MVQDGKLAEALAEFNAGIIQADKGPDLGLCLANRLGLLLKLFLNGGYVVCSQKNTRNYAKFQVFLVLEHEKKDFDTCM